jgi:hypothetical protein
MMYDVIVSSMHRSQIMLEEEQYRFLADEARRKGKSISALLREWIDQRIQARHRLPLEHDPLWDMVGIAHGGPGRISEDHDRYLAQARLRRMSRHPRRRG